MINLKKLDVNNFSTWKEYYFQYQKLLAADYYIPRLKSWGVDISINGNILDIGCGDGGFITAFKELNCECIGVEKKDFNWELKNNVTFLVGDITEESFRQQVKNKWDLVILRDVIEHIPLNDKLIFLNAVYNLMTRNSTLLITFPPFYSPFGLHQQTLLKSFLRFVPYLGWIPKRMLISILNLIGDNQNTSEIDEIYDCKMTIRQFNHLINESGFIIKNHEKYLIRPSHEIRYGIKMRKANLTDLPILREGLVTGCTFILSKN